MDKDKKQIEIYKIIIAVLLTASITFSLTLFGYYHYLEKSGALVGTYKESKDIAKNLDVLKTYISNYYKGDINDEELEAAALKGYVSGLGDEYTTFMTKDEWDQLDSSLSEYIGIGVYIAQLKNTNEVVILSVIGDDSPAKVAGIKAGDIIIEVDGENVEGKELNYISSKVKGEDGTKVNVKVKREEEILEFTLDRKNIKVSEIKSKMLENNIGYIDFDSFTETSYDEFKSAYESLKSQGANKLIVDLRDNTGGYVVDALNIADMFIEKNKTLLVTEDKNGNKSYEKSKSNKEINMPVVLLVNEYSASASEILTGILKDYQVATIVGSNTFGKGVIQSVITDVLGGALKITTSEYFTPKENKINKVGIEPDVKIDEKESEEDENSDVWLNKAIEVVESK